MSATQPRGRFDLILWRAHSHLFWTGAGRAVPRVRFLLPISVKGGALVEEPEAPVVGKVGEKPGDSI
jgi:hypothetical protein